MGATGTFLEIGNLKYPRPSPAGYLFKSEKCQCPLPVPPGVPFANSLWRPPPVHHPGVSFFELSGGRTCANATTCSGPQPPRWGRLRHSYKCNRCSHLQVYLEVISSGSSHARERILVRSKSANSFCCLRLRVFRCVVFLQSMLCPSLAAGNNATKGQIDAFRRNALITRPLLKQRSPRVFLDRFCALLADYSHQNNRA